MEEGKGKGSGNRRDEVEIYSKFLRQARTPVLAKVGLSLLGTKKEENEWIDDSK